MNVSWPYYHYLNINSITLELLGTHDFHASAYHEFTSITWVCYMGMLAIVELTRPIGYWNHVGTYGLNLSAEFGNSALVKGGRE